MFNLYKIIVDIVIVSFGKDLRHKVKALSYFIAIHLQT